jgi:addiction module HigA family antidote
MKSSITPGEILLEEYLRPMGISQNAMARAIGVPPRAINEIVLGKRAITPSMSIRFGAFFGQSDTFWHGIQVEYDFRSLNRKRLQLISGIQPASSWSNLVVQAGNRVQILTK